MFPNFKSRYFNLKFKTSLSYDRLASIIFSLLLKAQAPLKLSELYKLIRPVSATSPPIRLAELTEQITQNLADFLSPLQYYEPMLDNIDTRLTLSHVNPRAKCNANRKPSYVFKHASIRDWWLRHQIQQPQHVQDLSQAEWLLGMRLFNMDRVNCKLVLAHLGYLLNSKCMDASKLLYLLTVSMPVKFRLEYIVVSNEFLLAPDPRVFELMMSNYEAFFVTSNLCGSSTIPPFVCLLASLGQIGLVRSLLDRFNLKLGDDLSSSNLNGKKSFLLLIL